MNRLLKTLLFWTLLLGACIQNFSSPQPFPAPGDPTLTPLQPSDLATVTETSLGAPATVIIVDSPPIMTTVTADASSSANECGYQWAYQDLPELTAQFDQAIKKLIPDSNSHATAFGENCIGNDGQVIRFLAMETDFHVIVTTETVNDYETIGNWIAQVMQVVNALPRELIVGPKSGFVQFVIEKDLSNSISINVPVQGYEEITSGKTGEELFRIFYAVP